MSFPDIGIVSIFGGWNQLTIDIGDNGLFVEMAARIQISKNLPGEIARQEEFWSHRTSDLQSLLPAARFSVPQIMPVDMKNIYIGPRPSLLQSPIEFWPNITIRAGNARPSRGAQLDQSATFDMDLYVEVMTYAGPVDREHLHLQEGIDAEGDVNVQCHLLANAVYMSIVQDPSLGGAIPEIQSPPTITPSFPTAVAGDDQERTGDYYLYQGRQMLYTITRNSF